MTNILHTHGRAVLLESAVDDTLSVIKEIQDEVNLLVEKEDVHDKHQQWSLFAAMKSPLKSTWTNWICYTIQYKKWLVQILITFINVIQFSLEGLVDSRLIELCDANNQDNKEYAQSRVRSAKSAIFTQAFDQMKTQWVQLVDTLHKAA